MKRCLYKLLLFNIDYQEPAGVTQKQNIISGIILYSLGPLAIVFLSGHLILQLIIACLVVLLTVYSLLRAIIISQIKGAEMALRNPPAPGETWITIKDGDFILWESKKFDFLSGLLQGPLILHTTANETPGREADWQQWHDAYYFVIAPNIGKLSVDEILKELGKLRYPANKKSFRKIRSAGEAGYLMTFRGKES